MAKGLAVYINRMPEIRKLLKKASEEKIKSATLEWHRLVVKNISGMGSGKTYRVPYTKRTYTASAPGQYPAKQIGTLAKTYAFRFGAEGGNPFGEVGSPQDYAVYLEKGTSKMAPRPHLERTFRENRQKIIEILSKKWI